MKAGCGKTARPVCAADGGQRESNRARLLRPDSWEADEQDGAIRCGAGGAKGGGRGECEPAQSRGTVSQALARIRQAARQRTKEKFTALLHHIGIDQLDEAFFELKEDAAAGVDGLS